MKIKIAFVVLALAGLTTACVPEQRADGGYSRSYAAGGGYAQGQSGMFSFINRPHPPHRFIGVNEHGHRQVYR